MAQRFELKIDNAVFQDLDEITAYYDVQSERLGHDFLKAFWDCTESIEANPLTHQIQIKAYRFALVERFPYLVIYAIIEHQIRILKVIHAKRHPAKRYSKKRGK